MVIAQLEAFLAVAERGSVSRAAKALYLTQRAQKGVRLTQAGHAFRPFAQRTLQTVADGRSVVMGLVEGNGARLLLGAAPAASAYLCRRCSSGREHKRRPPVHRQPLSATSSIVCNGTARTLASIFWALDPTVSVGATHADQGLRSACDVLGDGVSDLDRGRISSEVAR